MPIKQYPEVKKRYRRSPKGKLQAAEARKRYWAKLSPEQRAIRNAANKEERVSLRIRAFTILGNQCCVCGESDPIILQLDHINQADRMRHTNREQELRIRLREETVISTYQLMCANCHLRKTRLNGEYNQGRWMD